VISHPNPTADPEGVGEARILSSRSSGRHRAPATTLRPHLTLPQLSRAQLGAGPVAKAGAVIAVSGGLVASLGMQAAAAPATLTASGSRASTSASGVPGALTTQAGTALAASRQVAAPQAPSLAQGQFGEIGFTATPARAPRKAVKATARPFVKVSRSTTRTSVKADPAKATRSTGRSSTRSDSGTDTGQTSTQATTTDAGPSASIRAGAPGSAAFGAAVMAIAARYAGIAYRYGGTTPAGFDCSGFTGYVMRQVGIDLPRTSGAQRAAKTRISRSEAVPGDLVFMPGHVGIYAGGGMMWDSPRTGEVISRRAIYSSSATYGRVG
jgi:cell wall-associated NlpC family hydrolase